MNSGLEKLALQLFDCGSFKDKTHADAVEFNGQRGFRLKLHDKTPGAPPSPFYLNLRTPDNPKPGPLTPEIVADCAVQLCQQTRHIEGPFNVVGIPNAGEPLAHAFMCVSRGFGQPVNLLHLRKETGAGERRIVGPVEGVRGPDKRVVLLDDLITQADSKLEAVQVLRAGGFNLVGVFVLVDRQQGGAEELRKHSLTLRTLFSLDELLGCYVDHGRITADLRDEILTYARAN